MKRDATLKLAPFFVSSVPKSGTHLLQQIVNGIPGANHEMDKWDHKIFKYNQAWNRSIEENERNKFLLLKPGQYAIGHVHYLPEYADLLKKLHFKHIFLYRDPRDVVLSLSYYIARQWKDHPLHALFNHQVLQPKARMMMLLQGVPGIYPEFMKKFGPCYGWLRDSDCLKIRFEDLISSKASRRQVIHRIADFLWQGEMPPMPKERMVELAIKNINPRTSATFRKGISGEWRQEADEPLKTIMKQRLGQLLIETGYEKDLHWE